MMAEGGRVSSRVRSRGAAVSAVEGRWNRRQTRRGVGVARNADMVEISRRRVVQLHAFRDGVNHNTKTRSFVKLNFVTNLLGALSKKLLLMGGGTLLGSACYTSTANTALSGGSGGFGRFNGGGSGGDGSGWNGNGGSPFSQWDWDPFMPALSKADSPESYLFVQDIKMTGLPVGPGCPLEDDLVDQLGTRVGSYTTKEKLADDEQVLMGYGIFENVTAKIKYNGESPDGLGKKIIVTFEFEAMKWPELNFIEFSGTGWYFPKVRILA